MKLLQELLSLNEAPNVPIELEKLGKKAVQSGDKSQMDFLQSMARKHWGGANLMWHGMRFFDQDGDTGPAYDKSIAAVEEAFDVDDIKAESSMYLNANNYVAQQHSGGDEHDDDMPPGEAEIEWEETFYFKECQEVYIGYSPKRDKLYVGFDAWGNDEEFNNAFDKAFEEATGEEHNLDKEEHDELYREVWKEYTDGKMGFYGLLFEITDHNGEFHAELAYDPMQGGFYRGVYKIFKRNEGADVIDLRLD